MMKTTLWRSAVFLAWLCLAYLPAHAQNKTEKPDSVPRYRWEVGTDMLWLIDKNTIPATSVFFRKHNEKGAWRLRVGGSYVHNIVDNNQPKGVPNTFPKVPNNTEDIVLSFVRIGYQWNREMKFFNGYFGIDAYYKRQSTKKNEYLFGVGTLREDYHEVTKIMEDTKGLSLFFGIQKYFWRRLSISIEFDISGYHNSFSSLKSQYEYPTDNPDTGYWTYKTTSDTNIKISPFYVLNFSYHF